MKFYYFSLTQNNTKATKRVGQVRKKTKINSPLVVVLLFEGSNSLLEATSDGVDRNRCVQLQVKF